MSIDDGQRRLVERPDLRGFGIEWADAGRLIVSKGDSLLEIRNGQPPRILARFPQPLWRRLAASPRLGQRALRYMFYNVLPMANGDLFVSFGQEIAIVGEAGPRAVRGLGGPFRVLRNACATSADGSIVFGEYRRNPDGKSIRLYRYWPGGDAVEVVYVFPENTIRHVHGVYFDPFTKGLWCLAGDIGSQCRILYSEDGFRTHEVVGSGDETWRAVSIQFTGDAVFYAMDAEFTQNFVYRLDRRTREREIVCAVEGPVYYSTALGSDLFFGVTAELCPSQQGDFAAVWHVDAERGVTRRLGTFQKDKRSPYYFMPGTIDFSRGDGSRAEVFFRTTAVLPENSVFAIR